MVSHRRTILRIAVFVLSFAAFARLIPCEFTWWDDQYTIHQNPRLNPPRWDSLGYYWTHAGEVSTMGLYVPVTYTVWAGLAWVAQRDQPDDQGLMLRGWVFHSANVLIHACTAVLVFSLLMRLICDEYAAGVGALLFALHPVQVESVGWVSGTKDLLCGLFATAALLMYVRSVQLRSDQPHQRGPSRWRYLIGSLFFVLAMLSKPTGVMTPVMAGVIGIFLLDRPVRRTMASLVPWFVLMIPCLIWTRLLQPAGWASPLAVWTRPVVAADAIAFYFYKLVWPIQLCIDYGHNPRAVAGGHLLYFTWILPVAVVVILWRHHESRRPAVAAAFLFVLPLVPVLGFVPFDFQSASTTADHYLYLPMLGAGVLAAWAIRRFRIPMWITAVILVGLGTRSVLQEPVWPDTRSLFSHTLEVNPTSIRACDGLGFISAWDARRLIKIGRSTEAGPLFDESIHWYRRSLGYDPISVPSMLNLALDYQAIGRLDLGLEQIHRMVQVQAGLPQGLQADPLVLAHLLIDFGDAPGAIAWLDEVLRRDPRNTDAAVLRASEMEHLHHPV